MADEGKKNKKGKGRKKNEPLPGLSSTQDDSKYDLTKERRTLRFQLPTSDISSEESFISALSYTPLEEDDDDSRSERGVSILRKYVFTPIRHTQPRAASKMHCCLRPEEVTSHLFSDSSRQLFETSLRIQFLLNLSLPEHRQGHHYKAGIFQFPWSSVKYFGIKNFMYFILMQVVKHSPTPSDANLNLINATYLRKIDAVKEAIKEGADVNTSRNGQTALLIAAEIGDDRMVSYLLTVPNINPDFQNHFGQTPLIVAVRNAFDQIVTKLLNNNADVNLADKMGKTPLLAAIFQKRLSLIKLLLAYGADCNKPDLFGENPLYAAAIKVPDLECLLTLLKVGASPECLNLSGTPLLSTAILCFTDFSIIEALIQYGASVNYADLITKKTPLHFAALTNDLKIAKYLVRQGANVNLKTTYGLTPLQEAQMQKSTLVAEFLLTKTEPRKKMPSKWPKKGRTDVLSTV